MEMLSWSHGLALILFALLGVYIAWLGLCSNPARKWRQRLERIEAGRRRQEAEFIANNCFKDWRKS